MLFPQLSACLLSPLNTKDYKYDLPLTWLLHFKKLKPKLTEQSKLVGLQGQEQISLSGSNSLWGENVPTESTSQSCFLGVCFGDWKIDMLAPGLTGNRRDGEGGRWVILRYGLVQAPWGHKALHIKRIRSVARSVPSSVPTTLWHLCAPIQWPLPSRSHPLFTYFFHSHTWDQCLHFVPLFSIPSRCQTFHIKALAYVVPIAFIGLAPSHQLSLIINITLFKRRPLQTWIQIRPSAHHYLSSLPGLVVLCHNLTFST